MALRWGSCLYDYLYWTHQIYDQSSITNPLKHQEIYTQTGVVQMSTADYKGIILINTDYAGIYYIFAKIFMCNTILINTDYARIYYVFARIFMRNTK